MTDQINGSKAIVCMMMQYMAWANEVMLNSVLDIPDDEIVKPRQALFGNIAHTFNHILVIEKVFQAHLEGKTHNFTSRNTDETPPFLEIKEDLNQLDQYYVGLAKSMSEAELNDKIKFKFIGGDTGIMTPMEIFLHLANHATYHRGFISDMLCQVPHMCNSSDLTIFLRDVWPAA